MIHVIAQHKVKDYDAWKEIFDNFSDVRKSSGELSFKIYHSKLDKNDLTLMFEWDSAENAEKFMNSDELRSAMEKGGVSEAPNIKFLGLGEQGNL